MPKQYTFEQIDEIRAEKEAIAEIGASITATEAFILVFLNKLFSKMWTLINAL